MRTAAQDLFSFAERCLHSRGIEHKLEATDRAIALWKQGRLTRDTRSLPRPIGDTVFPDQPQLVSPRQLHRRHPGTAQGAIALLHSIAHIEFYAIHLAWDILYRFRHMPDAFYDDWLRVANEEALHFRLIRQRLQSLGSDYGRLPAHRGLWEVAEETNHDLLERLALVPRFMEARGLDVTPAMIERFRSYKDHDSAAILTRILDDEVAHVSIGTRWFRYLCAQRQIQAEPTYFDILQRCLRGTIRGPFNVEARRQAGFSEYEIERLQQISDRGATRKS